MSVAEILEEVSKLSPAERQQVVDALLQDAHPAASEDESVEQRQDALIRRLHAQGVIKNIPNRNAQRDFEPVPIEGRPLSETIIEERR